MIVGIANKNRRSSHLPCELTNHYRAWIGDRTHTVNAVLAPVRVFWVLPGGFVADVDHDRGGSIVGAVRFFDEILHLAAILINQ